MNGWHRSHHQFLANVLTHLHPQGIDPTKPYPEDVRGVMLRTLREICGLDLGFSHGRGGSMHLQWLEAGAIGTNAIVGGGVPLAAGSAWAHKQASIDAVAITYFGDGGTNIGSTLETLNLGPSLVAAALLFHRELENNQYAVSTHVSEVTAEPRLSGRGPGFGIRSWKVDGMDPLAMRTGKGPAVIEADDYRHFHQNGPFRDVLQTSGEVPHGDVDRANQGQRATSRRPKGRATVSSKRRCLRVRPVERAGAGSALVSNRRQARSRA